MSRRPIVVAVASGLIVVLAHGRGAAAPVVAPATPPLYIAKCAACHGMHLEGGAAPALKSASIAGEDAGDIYAVVKNQMPLDAPGALGDADAKMLTDFIVESNKVH